MRIEEHQRVVVLDSGDIMELLDGKCVECGDTSVRIEDGSVDAAMMKMIQMFDTQ